MRIAVYETRPEDHPPERGRQRIQYPPSGDPGLGRSRLDAPLSHPFLQSIQRHALDEVHDQHPLADQLSRGEGYGDRPIGGPAVVVVGDGQIDLSHRLRLGQEVQFPLQRVPQFAEDRVIIDRQRFGEGPGDALQIRNVSQQLRFDVGTLKLHGDDPSVQQRGLVHLGDAGRSQRLLVEGGEQFRQFRPVQQFPAHDPLDQFERHPFDPVLQAGQFFRVRLRE
mmetsp:Transcript_36371/g.109166  ORF Transcript_36371/g.109166 Transcript_36371/m.109166 type:complete len:223 (+) Transcript_36371:996-1664(+)